MTQGRKLRIRRDIRKIEAEWRRGIDAFDVEEAAELRKPLEDLIRAFKGIQELPPDHPQSYFRIAGYHGEPLRGAGRSDGRYWGGYCNHGNVLFPVWHRAYLLELENALRSIEGCEDVALPYWNETDDATKEHGLPRVFLMPSFPLDGTEIHNPLFSYRFQSPIRNNLSAKPGHDYTKPKGYETVRYPFSGLVGEKDRATTDEHNAKMKVKGEQWTSRTLNENVIRWLGGAVTNWANETVYVGARGKFERCLESPNYTVFSNTTSAAAWNEDNFKISESWAKQNPEETKESAFACSIEDPHNAIHLAIGGFEVPAKRNVNAIAGANGDMGENNTASFDPIFFFHHVFIDLLFWQWQKRHDRLDFLDVIDGYPGTSSSDDQGPTAGIPNNTFLSMKSPLEPFHTWKYAPCEMVMIPEHMQDMDVSAAEDRPLQETEGILAPSAWTLDKGNPPPVPVEWPIRSWPMNDWPPSEWPPREWPHQMSVTGDDVVNIIKLGYSYEEPPLAWSSGLTVEDHPDSSVGKTESTPVLQVPQISREGIAGSFVVSTWANDQLLDLTPVLSRWYVQGCANCLTHLSVQSYVPLYGWSMDEVLRSTFTFRIHVRKHNDERKVLQTNLRGVDSTVKIGIIVDKGVSGLLPASNKSNTPEWIVSRSLIGAKL